MDTGINTCSIIGIRRIVKLCREMKGSHLNY